MLPKKLLQNEGATQSLSPKDNDFQRSVQKLQNTLYFDWLCFIYKILSCYFLFRSLYIATNVFLTDPPQP